MKKGITSLFVLSLTALFVPVQAYAEIPDTLKTIKVYGELPYVVNALERLALIMSDATYQGLFFGIIVMLLVGGGLTLLVKSLTGGKISALIWAFLFGTLLCGVIVYHTFIRNTTTVLVTDETIGGKFKSVGGIPDGVAFLAGLMNKIESGIVEMIWTAGDVEGFREEAGGIGFDIINKAFGNGVDLSMVDPDTGTGKYVNISIRRYIEDCFLFEVGRPGSSVNVNDLNRNTDFTQILALAANPAIFTVRYDAANPNGVSLSCQQDWENFLSPYLTGLTAASATVGTFWTHKCAEADLARRNYITYGGLDIEDICRDKVDSLLSSLLGVAVTSDQLMRQYLIASELDRVVREGAPDQVVKTIGNYRKGVDMIGAGIMLNEWLPIIKGVYYAIFLGLIPFLFLLIPTPLFPRVVTFILGSFVFLSSWGICDAIVHSTAMDYAANTFREIAEGQLGLKSMLLFESESYKAMAAFGASRLMALSMAAVMSATLIRFGGSAFAHMIHRSPIAAGSHGRAAAELTSQGDPATRAAYERSVSEAYPTQAWANDYAFRDRVTAGTYKRMSGIESSLQTVHRLGGAKTAAVKMGGVAGMQATDQVIRTGEIRATAHRAGVTEDHVQHIRGAGQFYNEASKMAIRKGLDEIAATGRMSAETQKVLSSIAQDDTGRAMLASQGIGNRVIKPEEAKHVAKFFADHGKEIDPTKLAGATAQMNLWTDEKGRVHPSLLATKEGVVLSTANFASDVRALTKNQVKAITGKEGPPGKYTVYATSEGTVVGIEGKGGYRASTGNVIIKETADGKGHVTEKIDPDTGKTVRTSIQRGTDEITHASEKIIGWSGSFAGYEFLSATRTDLGGGMTEIRGVTKDGKVIQLVGQMVEGKERIVSAVVKQGPNYEGAFAMAAAGEVPIQVLHNQTDSVLFADDYAKGVSKFYTGTMKKEEFTRFNQAVSAGLGINILARLGGSVVKEGGDGTSERSTTDVAARAAYTVAMSDLTDRQKQVAFQKLNRIFINMKAERAEDLPKASVMVGRGGRPLGEIRNEK